MSDVDVTDLDAFTLHLRSKTALGRLNEMEVRSVLAHLADLGMVFVPPPALPEPIAEPASVIAPLPEPEPATTLAPPPVS